MSKRENNFDNELSDLVCDLGGLYDKAGDENDRDALVMLDNAAFDIADILEQTISDFDREGFLLAISLRTAINDKKAVIARNKKV